MYYDYYYNCVLTYSIDWSGLSCDISITGSSICQEYMTILFSSLSNNYNSRNNMYNKIYQGQRQFYSSTTGNLTF